MQSMVEGPRCRRGTEPATCSRALEKQIAERARFGVR